MQNRFILPVLFIVLVLFSRIQLSKAETIDEIRTLYSNINQLVNHDETKQILMFANPEDSKQIWSIVKKNQSADLFKKSQYRATVYVNQDRVIKTIIAIDSRAGDWSNTKDYYFYENGNIAFIFETHLTYVGYDFDQDKNLPPGPYIIEKRNYYDRKGEKVKFLEKAFISSTKKSIPVKFLNQVDFGKDTDYKNVKSLPFFDLIKAATETK